MLSYPDAYLEYLFHFHGSRDFFECHEIMEEYWKEHPRDPHSRTYVALIQIAVAMYHHRRGNIAGAVKMVQASLRNLQDDAAASLGLDAAGLRRMLQCRLESLTRAEAPYADMNLPITDPGLIRQVAAICEERSAAWCRSSDMSDPELIHRHRLRDRSGVIEERQRAIKERSRAKGQRE